MRAPVASRLRGAAPCARECGRGQEEEDGVVRLLLAKMPTGFFFFFFFWYSYNVIESFVAVTKNPEV